jgi:D-galactose 1-dehydrogenase
MPHLIGLVGLGAIATKQHLPSIAKDPDFQLIAAASLAGTTPGVPLYPDHHTMLAAHPEIQAVIVCTPPIARLAIAADILATGRAVMLEKPPAATPGGLAYLVAHAARHNALLHTAWHSQYNTPVARVRDLLKGRQIKRLHMIWKEDVHKWHPGQTWIWQAGGFGVFDAGINGLSILTYILDRPLFATAATLHIPTDAEVPIAAQFTLSDGSDAHITGDLDWAWQGPDNRQITIETADGQTIELLKSGAILTIDGTTVLEGPRDEYGAIYRDFATLLTQRRSSIDAAPLALVADIFLAGHSVPAPAVQRT